MNSPIPTGNFPSARSIAAWLKDNGFVPIIKEGIDLPLEKFDDQKVIEVARNAEGARYGTIYGTIICEKQKITIQPYAREYIGVLNIIAKHLSISLSANCVVNPYP